MNLIQVVDNTLCQIDNEAQKQAYIEYPEVSPEFFGEWFAEYRDMSEFGEANHKFFFKDFEAFAVVSLNGIVDGEYKFSEEWVDDINELLTLLKGGK